MPSFATESAARSISAAARAVVALPFDEPGAYKVEIAVAGFPKPLVEKMFWYWYYDDNTDTPNYFFAGCGIFDRWRNPKPSAASFAALRTFIPGKYAYLGTANLGPNGDKDPTKVYLAYCPEGLVAALDVDDSRCFTADHGSFWRGAEVPGGPAALLRLSATGRNRACNGHRPLSPLYCVISIFCTINPSKFDVCGCLPPSFFAIIKLYEKEY